jgi:hypothetical protein
MGGTVAIDATRAFGGKNSVKVSATGPEARALFTLSSPFFPLRINEFYGRVMVWVDAVPANTGWAMIQSSGPAPAKSSSALYAYGGLGPMINAEYYSVDLDVDCWKDGGAVPIKRWACMEWHFKGATNELELWVDGVADRAHVVGTGDACSAGPNRVWDAPIFSQLDLGFEGILEGGKRYDLWFDDVAVSSTRIGCPAR